MRSPEFRFNISTIAGSTLGNIRELQRLHHVEPKYRKKFFLSKAIAGLLEAFTRAERLVWERRIRNHTLTAPPVFIIGLWRSGTTLLHNLLCQDPEAAYTTTFHAVFPNVVLTQSWWLKPLVNRFLPAERPYDKVTMSMDLPQEEDFGMMNLQPVTIYKFLLFPAEFDSIIEKELTTDCLSPRQLSGWKEAYRNMVTKAVFNTGGTRYIGKNPCNLSKTALLREMYPGAKFILIHRHPYEVIESMYRFFLSIFPGVQLQDVPEEFSREKLVRLFSKITRVYLDDRKSIPEADLMELRMDDFLADPEGHLEKIYHKFGLGDFTRASPRIRNFMEQNPRSRHAPDAPTEETIRLVDQYAREIITELGYN